MIFIRKVKVDCGVALLKHFESTNAIEVIQREDNFYNITFSVISVDECLAIEAYISDWYTKNTTTKEWSFVEKEESEPKRRRI